MYFYYYELVFHKEKDRPNKFVKLKEAVKPSEDTYVTVDGELLFVTGHVSNPGVDVLYVQPEDGKVIVGESEPWLSRY